MATLRKTLTRLGLLLALVVPPVVHTGCVKDIAYQIRLDKEARKHVYEEKKSAILASAKKAAEGDGWTVSEGEEGEADLVGKPRKVAGRKERLAISLVKSGDGYRLEADREVEMETAQGKKTSLQPATTIEMAVLEDLDPKAAAKVRGKAKALAKEDTKMIRACAKRAVDVATEDGEE
jgi:hypothetical protein